MVLTGLDHSSKNAFKSYVVFLLVVTGLLAGVYEGYQQWQRLSCWGGGYVQDAWMSYCESKRFGSYEHAAVFFGLEPEIREKMAEAQILTLSGSRLQEALSIAGASDWFKERGLRLYMLGFGYDEQSGFAEMLLSKYQTHPDVLVINADPYLTGQLSDVAKLIKSNPHTEVTAALELRRFEEWHRWICARIDWICRGTNASFRARSDGHWIFSPDKDRDKPRSMVLPAAPTESARLAKYLENAKRLLRLVNVDRRCVIFTTVPSTDQSGDVAAFLAERLGARSVLPEVHDLHTRDGSHLTPESAGRWTRSFLTVAEPIFNECISPREPRSVSTTSDTH